MALDFFLMPTTTNGDALLKEVERLDKEAKTIYRALVLPNWGKDMHGFPDTLYGFMMGVFARVDLVSAYWKGTFRNQTARMVGFLDGYVHRSHEAHSVAVQVWRHKLMHTSSPRYLRDDRTNKDYRWLLHWWDHLPPEQHYTFVDTGDSRILNIGLIYLIADLKRGLENYLLALRASQELTARFARVEQDLRSFKYREIT